MEHPFLMAFTGCGQLRIRTIFSKKRTSVITSPTLKSRSPDNCQVLAAVAPHFDSAKCDSCVAWINYKRSSHLHGNGNRQSLRFEAYNSWLTVRLF